MNSKHFRYTALSLLSAASLSSCGLLGGLDRNRDYVQIKPDDVLLIASLGASETQGAIESYLINPRTLKTRHTGTTYTASPTFLTLDPSKSVLYATNETTEEATASAFGYGRTTGVLTPINSSLVLGEAPTYISVAGDKVVTANYGSGSITMMYRGADGSLGQADWRIELGPKGTSHPHATVFSPDGKDLFVTDLGQDRIYHFNVSQGIPPLTIDDAGAKLPEGTGPRHLIFGKTGDYLYLIAEKSPKILVFKQHGGSLSLVQEVSTGAKGTGAHIALSPDGRFLYTSFRSGGDGIMVHSIAPDGKLMYVDFTPTLSHPRQFAISPDGRYVAVAARDGNQVTFFDRDPNFGTLTPSGISIPASRPMFVLWTTSK